MFGIPINGSYVATGLVGFVFIFGMVFWWFQEHVFYVETWSETVEIAGETYEIDRWQGIDADTSPLKMRACFSINATVAAPPELDPQPLTAPRWFKCFSAEFIAKSLASEYARAVVAAYDEPKGFDRIVAIFPDGRAFMWRQPNGNLGQ